MSNSRLVSQGIYEFVFGGELNQRDALLEFWAVLGFLPQSEGEFTSTQAKSHYGHAQELNSIRLVHSGCNSYGTGFVRLQLWAETNEGLGTSRPLQTGSRWMGMYTRDILQLRDSFDSEQSRSDWNIWMSPLVSGALVQPPPKHSFFERFVGLRDMVILGDEFRFAFIQRAGFDRPGFGTFDDSLPFKNTEGSHANIVQPANSFSTEFYKAVFDYGTAPFGDARDSGDDEATIAILDLQPGETFRVERTAAVDCPTGLLQVYSPYTKVQDMRQQSRAGSRNLCLYTVRVSDIDEFASRIPRHGGSIRSGVEADEFGNPSIYFDAPDGYSWLAVADLD